MTATLGPLVVPGTRWKAWHKGAAVAFSVSCLLWTASLVLARLPPLNVRPAASSG